MTNAEIDYQVNLINDFKIQHPMLINALDVVKTAFTSVKTQRERHDGNIPASYRPQSGLIIGEPGSGKTTFCNFINESLPSQVQIKNGFSQTIIPCVYVSIANMNTPKTVTAKILEQFGQNVPSRATEHELLTKLKVLFTSCETSLLLLDEIHEIMPGTGRQKVMSWLKSLVNETKVSIFLAGTPEAKHIVYSNNELAGRFMHRIELNNMHFNSNNEQTDFENYLRTFLAKVQDTLPLSTQFSLSKSVLGKLYLSTQGNLRSIATLFIEACRIALKSNHDSLVIEHIEKAYTKHTLYLPNSYTGVDNPFPLSENELQNHLKMNGV